MWIMRFFFNYNYVVRVVFGLSFPSCPHALLVIYRRILFWSSLRATVVCLCSFLSCIVQNRKRFFREGRKKKRFFFCLIK